MCVGNPGSIWGGMSGRVPASTAHWHCAPVRLYGITVHHTHTLFSLSMIDPFGPFGIPVTLQDQVHPLRGYDSSPCPVCENRIIHNRRRSSGGHAHSGLTRARPAINRTEVQHRPISSGTAPGTTSLLWFHSAPPSVSTTSLIQALIILPSSA
eukprot:1580131-Prymnesium_polylepis.1